MTKRVLCENYLQKSSTFRLLFSSMNLITETHRGRYERINKPKENISRTKITIFDMVRIWGYFLIRKESQENWTLPSRWFKNIQNTRWDITEATINAGNGKLPETDPSRWYELIVVKYQQKHVKQILSY